MRSTARRWSTSPGAATDVGQRFPVNAAYPLFDDTIPQREFDLAKAAEHYKKSGHDGSSDHPAGV